MFLVRRSCRFPILTTQRLTQMFLDFSWDSKSWRPWARPVYRLYMAWSIGLSQLPVRPSKGPRRGTRRKQVE